MRVKTQAEESRDRLKIFHSASGALCLGACGAAMIPDEKTAAIPATMQGLKRVEHYALYLINGMAAAGSSGLSDGDIDYAIDVAERLASRLMERGHIPSHS